MFSPNPSNISLCRHPAHTEVKVQGTATAQKSRGSKWAWHRASRWRVKPTLSRNLCSEGRELNEWGQHAEMQDRDPQEASRTFCCAPDPDTRHTLLCLPLRGWSLGRVGQKSKSKNHLCLIYVSALYPQYLSEHVASSSCLNECLLR